MTTIPHWIDGARRASTSGRTAPVTDPSTGAQTAQVALASVAEVDDAVAAAKAAFPAWRDTSMARRTAILFRYRELLDQNRLALAELISAEHGKVLADALGEVARGLEVVEYACGLSEHLKGEHSQDVSTGIDVHSVRQPLGVMAGITPFNFPAMVPMWMYPVAIACGNTFVLKPSEKDPSVSMLAAELFTRAGLPDGVLNVVHGDVDAVHRILDHPDVAGVSFVGSTPIARAVYERGTAAGKRVQALGGAKNHMLVLPDADIDVAADSAVSAGYGSAGERCMAISVIVAVGDVADRLIPAIEQRTADLAVGPGIPASGDPADSPDMGPLVTKAHRDRVAGFVDLGVSEGADLVIDGRGYTPDDPAAADGFWLGPCLFDNVAADMEIYREEIFGPVLCVVRVGSYAEGLEFINGNNYGNGTAIFTGDGAAARDFQRNVTAGMVGVNVPIPVPVAFHSFGGWKDSLFGSSHIYGPEGIRFNTGYKAITSRWPSRADSQVSLVFPGGD